MKSQTVTGCGSGSCLCAGAAVLQPVATVNGVALYPEGPRPALAEVIQRTHDELLRQHAVRQGLLAPCLCLAAPQLNAQDRAVIACMLDREVVADLPTEEACRAYFEAHRHLFMTGQALHVRHILFAVTPGANVHALTVRAEGALLELFRQGTPPERFAQLAAELSDCPTSANGGDLGWIGPGDCAPELANELFDQRHSRWGMGVHPRLIHTGLGFHIIEVLGRRKGKQLAFDDVQARIADDLGRQARMEARRQYLRQLAEQARLAGVDLEGADSSWVE